MPADWRAGKSLLHVRLCCAKSLQSPAACAGELMIPAAGMQEEEVPIDSMSHLGTIK